ncbi:MAG: ArsA family ATPase [Candidatus Binataceae bacterium]
MTRIGAPNLKEILKRGSITILLGTGGVGKTTVAAALGIAGAAAHLNTAVITVDPAKRLRDALGLAHLGGKPVRIGAKRLRDAGLHGDLKLSAMVLDVKGAWDAVAERLAANPAARERILNNPFYKSLSSEFAGSEAFAALQQLYDLHQTGAFELEIVDTPPAAHAFEFIEAPARLMRLLDSRAARWIFTPSLSAGRIAARFAGEAARFVVRELERFAGGGVLSTISDFFSAAAEGIDAIVDRLKKTEALLHSNAVTFVLVTTAEADRLRQARDLMREMDADGLRLGAIVVNRFLDERTWSSAAQGGDALGHLEEIPEVRARLSEKSPAAGALAGYLENYGERTLADVARLSRFAHELPPGIELAIAPELDSGIGDLAALKRVADFITSGAAILKPLADAARRMRPHPAHAKHSRG